MIRLLDLELSSNEQYFLNSLTILDIVEVYVYYNMIFLKPIKNN